MNHIELPTRSHKIASTWFSGLAQFCFLFRFSGRRAKKKKIIAEKMFPVDPPFTGIFVCCVRRILALLARAYRPFGRLSCVYMQSGQRRASWRVRTSWTASCAVSCTASCKASCAASCAGGSGLRRLSTVKRRSEIRILNCLAPEEETITTKGTRVLII